MSETRLIDANALKEALHNFFDGKVVDEPAYILRDVFCHIDNAPTIEITEEQAIDKLHKTGWLPEHDKEMTKRPHTSKTCATCMYYLLRSTDYPCARCRRNNALVDEIREQQNDRWKDGTLNG